MSYDEYYKWDKYAVSLPVSRKTIVFSKYIFGILFNLAGVVIVAVVYIFTANITVASAIGESLLTLLGLCMISILFLSITLPIMFKFGVEKGRLLMMAVFFTPTILIMLISKLNIAKPSEQALQKLVLISPVIILVILLISIFVSIRIFERKEL
jgi:ABC-type transport system involved in multi-copper enzyme maturation permease subunit